MENFDPNNTDYWIYNVTDYWIYNLTGELIDFVNDDDIYLIYKFRVKFTSKPGNPSEIDDYFHQERLVTIRYSIYDGKFSNHRNIDYVSNQNHWRKCYVNDNHKYRLYEWVERKLQKRAEKDSLDILDNRILETNWGCGGRIHNWRNHVSEDMKKNWKKICPLARQLIYQYAKELANNETQWDE